MGRGIAEVAGWVSRRRYAVTALVVFALGARVSIEGRWGVGFDIWEHAAVVRELSLHPWHPGHPQLALPTTPHQFFSPYLLAVGLFARVTGATVPAALATAGLLNLALLLLLLPAVVNSLVGGRHTAFWALLLTVLAWGADPWFFSSFLHANVLFHQLAYPSTFARVLVLLAFWAEIRARRRADVRWATLVALAAGAVLLTHADDTPFLYIGLTAIVLGTPSSRSRGADLALVCATGLAALAMAALWPYFPFFEVFFGKANAAFRAGVASADGDMYTSVLRRSFLALFGLPFVAVRLRRNRTDPSGLMFVGALAVYAGGFWTRHYEVGRIVSWIAFTLHLALAGARDEAGEAVAAAGPAARPLARWLNATTLGLLLVGAYGVRQGLADAAPMVRSLLPREMLPLEADRVDVRDLDFLARHVAADDVVLADAETSWLVPSYAGKVVTVLHPLIFVDDLDERAVDVTLFFKDYVPESFRRAVIDKYGCRWLLLSRRFAAKDPTTFERLSGLGEVAQSTDGYLLLRLPAAGSGPANSGKIRGS